MIVVFEILGKFYGLVDFIYCGNRLVILVILSTWTSQVINK